jgi:hypothetical protein
VPHRQAAALHVELRPVDRAERDGEAESVAAEFGRLPRSQRAQHLGGKGLVDLVEVEVLQTDAGVLQHPRDRIGGRHQQPLVVDEVHGRHLAVAEVSQHRQSARVRPLVAREQHRRRAVGHRRGVPGRQRAGTLDRKGGLQLRQTLAGRVAPQVVVLAQSLELDDQVAVEALVVGRGGPPVTFAGQFVLGLAAHLPAPRHQLAALAH